MSLLLVPAMTAGVLLASATPTVASPLPTNTSTAVAYQLDTAHDGAQTDPDFSGTDQSVLWSKDLGGAVGYPLISGNTVFVAVSNTSANSTANSGTSISAFDRRSGLLKWGPVDIGGIYGFGAVALDGGRVFGINYSGRLVALDANTGLEIWSEQLPGQYAFTSAPTAVNGTVYVGGAGSGGTLYAVAESNGALRWAASVENGDSSSPAVDASGVYVSYACEQAYSFTTTGVLNWRHSTSCEGGGGRNDVLHGGKVYLRDDAGFAPAVLSETDGSQLGSFVSTPAPAIDDDSIVTLSSGTITGSDLISGAVKWSHAPITGGYVTAPLIINGVVVEGDSTGRVHLFDGATGAETWSGSAGAPISAPDEHNAFILTGLAEAQGVLAVPAGNRLTVFGRSGLWITAGPASGAITGSSAEFTFASNVPDATFSCSLDQAVAAACSSPFSLSGLPDGQHSLTVTLTAGGSPQAVTSSFVTDAAAPAANVVGVGQYSGLWTTTRSWGGSDALSGIASYDIRYRVASSQSGFGAYQQPASLQETTATTVTLRPAPGSTVCVSVRARDRVGNLGTWSADSCQSVLLDDHSLTASGSWYRPGGAPGYANATYSGTTARGAALTLATVHARRIAIVATVCPTCGRLAVAFPGMATTTLNLHSAQTVRQTFYAFTQQARVTTGRLTLTALDAGKAVIVDAVSAWQN
jgi:outer membrane protein assembly factor BamB